MWGLVKRVVRTRVVLGRWAAKTVPQQKQADVNDPGYDQMHWSDCAPGPKRQEAIRRHYEAIEQRLGNR